jgi:hypothetical protein
MEMEIGFLMDPDFHHRVLLVSMQAPLIFQQHQLNLWNLCKLLLVRASLRSFPRLPMFLRFQTLGLLQLNVREVLLELLKPIVSVWDFGVLYLSIRVPVQPEELKLRSI